MIMNTTNLKILIVSGNSEMTAVYNTALQKAGADDISLSETGYVEGFDVVIFNLPLEGRFGLDEAAAAAKTESVFVLAVAPQKNMDEIIKRLGDSPLMLLARPFSADAFELTVRNIFLMAVKTLSYRGKLIEAENKISDIKLIERAKFTLVEYLSLNEAEAHRYIQKNAMDRRVKQVEVAKEVLRTYEVY
jgi:response regulator NasT